MRLLSLIGALAIIAAVAVGVYFFGGFYSVGATYDDPAPVAWALAQVRQASISRHAVDTPPAPLDDPARVQAGAKAFASLGCVECHGAPGVDWAKFSEGITPGPPDLGKEIVPVTPPGQIFWAIKNGIRMTAMPAFGSNDVDDKEIWAITAFVMKIGSVSAADYKSWTVTPQLSR